MAQEFGEEDIINMIRQYGMNDYEARAIMRQERIGHY